MDKTLEDFHSELRNEILVEAESSNELTEDSFFYFLYLIPSRRNKI